MTDAPMNQPSFIPGLQLNEMFYEAAVKPTLERNFPALVYSAALMGYGSDVLGFDTPLSTDHNWGPRLQLFLPAADYETYRLDIHNCLAQELPLTFRGFPVNFDEPDQDDNGTQSMQLIEAGPVHHLIEIYTIAAFFEYYLHVDPYAEPQPFDWLTFSEQALLEVTAGKVFHDGLGELNRIRARFAYYPHDVWLYRLAAQWQRISQEEAFMGRCGDVGDELGSRLIAARQVRDLMRLAFLLEKQYAPYSKWLGTGFARLTCGPQLIPIFNRVLNTTPWMERQDPLCEAYLVLADMHNSLGITTPIGATISDYFGRPYQVLFAGRFTEATKKAITDERLKNIPADIGGIDQFADCVDLTDHPKLARKMGIVYE